MNSRILTYILFTFAGIIGAYLAFTNLLPKSTKAPVATNSENSSHIVVLGNNSFGQLGKASYELNSKINDIFLPGKISQLVAGRNYNFAVTSESRVYSWGGNEWGQLGYPTEATYYNPTPKEITALSNVQKVDAKNNHTLFLLKDGSVYAAGSNFSGQLGNGNNDDSSNPIKVEGLVNVKDIAAGYKFSLAVDSNGTVWGWGASCSGDTKKQAEVWWKNITAGMNQIDGGYYDASSDSLAQYDKTEYCINEDIVGILSKVPVRLKNLADIEKISAGYGHGLALSKSGGVWSFGCNTYKQLGRETLKKEDNQAAQQVEGLPKIKEIYAGYRHSLAIAEDGSVWGWGLNNHGQLGSKTEVELQVKPVKVSIENVKSLVAAFDYSLALKEDGSVWGWGMNRSKLIKDKEDEFIVSPVLLDNFKSVLIVSASGGHIAVLADE